MRKTLRHKPLTVLLGINYLILASLGFYFWQVIGAIGGVVLAYFIDRCFPRWTVDLTARDIERAIANQMKYGCVGSRLYILMGRKLFIVFRDAWHRKDRIGVQLPLADWGDLVSDDFLEGLHKRCPSTEFRSRWRAKDTLCLTPVSGVDGCVQIMREFMRQEDILADSLSARIDCAKKDIWKS